MNKSNAVSEVLLNNKPVSKLGIFDFYRLPHPVCNVLLSKIFLLFFYFKNGLAENVGTPFSKHYRVNFEQKQLWPYRFADVLADFLDSRSVTRFWGNYR